MTPIIAAACYLAVGAWLLIEMEATDRLGFVWTDVFVVLAAPICGAAWLLWDIAATIGRTVARWWR